MSNPDLFLKYHKTLNELGVNMDLQTIDDVKRKLESNQYIISVIGAMKSGKSTFIDALLGFELMPSENEACTLTTTDIHVDKFDGFITKVFTDGSKEKIKGNKGSLAKAFHQDVKKHRSSNKKVDFHYEVSSEMDCLKGLSSNAKFTIVDTPGVNEMSGLGIDKQDIKQTFTDVIKRSSSIVYVLDYQYYKAEENREIIKQIKKIRPDLLSNMIFILNKIDRINYKDKTMDSILTEISKALKSWGVHSFELYPVSAIKALYGRYINSGGDLTRIKENLGQYLISKELVVEGDTITVKERPEDAADRLITESVMNVFEENVLVPTYLSSSDRIKHSSNSLLFSISEQIKEKLDDIKNELLLGQKELDDELNRVQEKIQGINDTFKIAEEKRAELEVMLKKPTFDKVKAKEYHYELPYYPSVNSYSGYKYTSSYSAEREAKSEFSRWKSNIKFPFESIHSYYSRKLYYSTSTDNFFYKTNTKVSKVIQKLSALLDKELIKANSKEVITLMSNISVMPEPLMEMTYSNTREYVSDFYDNSAFIDTDYTEMYVGETIFGNSKYKDRYTYDLGDALRNEWDDVTAAMKNCSYDFFSDYYDKKYDTYLSELREVVEEEFSKIPPVLKSVLKQLEAQQKKLKTTKNKQYQSKLKMIQQIEKELEEINQP